MASHLCITVRWIYDRFHGLTEDKQSVEWPPSPLRLFQALVAGAHQHGIYASVLSALEWLQRQSAPEILALYDPSQGIGFDHYVPDNDQAFAHKKPGVRTFKPVLLEGQAAVHYAWRINADDAPPVDLLDELASTVSTLGCGIDQAYAVAKLATVAEVDEALLVSPTLHRFAPLTRSEATVGTLRVPKKGSLDDLRRVFIANRIASTTLHERRKRRWPLVFDRIVYSGMSPAAPRPCAIFKLLDDNLDTTRYPQPLLAHIAAVLRHAAIECMDKGRNAPSWIPEAERGPWVSRFVRGKNDPACDEHQQISYVPLPSIGYAHSDAMVRNVMLIAPIGRERELEHVAKRLDGVQLEFKLDAGEECDADTPPRVPLPHSIQRFTPPRGKFIDQCYLRRSKVWQSVTPVILDEHIHKKTRETKDGQKIKYRDEEDFKRLIILALQRAGIETSCTFIWQTLPFYRNCLSAHRYDRNKRSNFVLPKRLDGKTAVHVLLTFSHEIPGPITLGAGRHCGLGLFAAAESS